MMTAQEVQKLLDGVNFNWVDHEIFTNAECEVRNCSTFTVSFALLTEILSELKKTKKLVVKLQEKE